MINLFGSMTGLSTSMDVTSDPWLSRQTKAVMSDLWLSLQIHCSLIRSMALTSDLWLSCQVSWLSPQIYAWLSRQIHGCHVKFMHGCHVRSAADTRHYLIAYLQLSIYWTFLQIHDYLSLSSSFFFLFFFSFSFSLNNSAKPYSYTLCCICLLMQLLSYIITCSQPISYNLYRYNSKMKKL
jgi:hypothetical protein